MPAKVRVDKIKAKLLRPALTSHFLVEIPQPKGSFPSGYLSANGVNLDQEKLNLLCSEATLPGSSLATHENNSDFPGVTQKFAYRRLYDDRIDFTFYVDAENYLPIKYFESWIKFIVGESKSADSRSGKLEIKSSEYFYRVKYPEDYIAQSGLKVTKFERDHTGTELIYNFVSAYPIAITSMPVSYDASSLLKCNVSFSYIRYYIESLEGSTETKDSGSTTRSPNGAADSPYGTRNFSDQFQQVNFNARAFDSGLDFGGSDIQPVNTTGINFAAAFSPSFVTTGAGGADQQQDRRISGGFIPNNTTG
jgi:hypothetical protein